MRRYAAERNWPLPSGQTLALAIALASISGCGDAARTSDAPSQVAAAVEAPEPPRTVGLDSARMAEVVERAAALPRLRTLLVARHGEILLERHFRGPGLDRPANVKSVSKSVLSAVVGIALSEGHLKGTEQPIAPFFESHLRPDDDPRKRLITIGHLLSMQSGLERTSGANYGRWVTSRNWVSHAIGQPMVAEPGGSRLYSTGNSHLVSALLTQATGRSTWAYTREKLAEPLASACPTGRPIRRESISVAMRCG